MTKQQVGAAFRCIRDACGITQAAMCVRAETSIVWLSNIENGHFMPSTDLMQRYEDLFGIHPLVLAWAQASRPAMARRMVGAIKENSCE